MNKPRDPQNTFMIKNKNVDIKFSAHYTFLEYSSSGTLSRQQIGSMALSKHGTDYSPRSLFSYYMTILSSNWEVRHALHTTRGYTGCWH